jgi:hypothetical protein
VTRDFMREAYLALHDVIYRVAEAVQQVVPTERMCMLSLGSQQGNRLVHWHLALLPLDVPPEAQQFEALRMEKGVWTLSDNEMAALAAWIREEMGVSLLSEADDGLRRYHGHERRAAQANDKAQWRCGRGKRGSDTPIGPCDMGRAAKHGANQN